MIIVRYVIVTMITSVNDRDNEDKGNFYDDNYDDAFGSKGVNFLK
jgi:hypothetical protein